MPLMAREATDADAPGRIRRARWDCIKLCILQGKTERVFRHHAFSGRGHWEAGDRHGNGEAPQVGE